MFIEKRAIALGFFDGIHIGHTALLQRLVDVCNSKGLKSMVLTFDTLPQNQLSNSNIPLINSPEDKTLLILRRYAVDDIHFLPFDKQTADMTHTDFTDMLFNKYGAKHLIAGENFRFGKGAAGDVNLLRQICNDNSIGCDIIPNVAYDGIVCSSTYIRELLTAGDIKRANKFLGHPHILTDIVRNGNRLGSKLGKPTINMAFGDKVLVPKHGVYVTKAYSDNSLDFVFPGKNDIFNASYATAGSKPAEIKGLPAVTNIGIRPTVDDTGAVTVETHIPGFNKNLYGCKVRIEFYDYIRPEMKFGNTDELKKQIETDCDAAIAFFTNEL